MADFTGTGGNDAQNGTSANESFDYSQGGDDTLTGGDGNDTFQMGASLGAGDSVDGGAGIDILELDGNYSNLNIGVNVTGVEQLKLATGRDYEIDVATIAVGTAGMKIDGAALGVGDVLDISIDAAATGPIQVLAGGGNDVISLALTDAGSLVNAGAGNDTVTILGGIISATNLAGGVGTDTLSLDAAVLAVADFSAASTGFEELDLGKVSGDDTDNTIDLSGFSAADADAYNVRAERGNDVVTGLDGAAGKLHGNKGHDTLTGGDQADRLRGNKGNDGLNGSAGDDMIKGGAGVDELNGGVGIDTFYYSKVVQSSGRTFDIINGFDADEDGIGFIGLDKPAAVDAAITAGTLGTQNFNADLEAAVDAAKLGADNAVLFTADAGRLAGKTFLVIDGNGTAGYQAGEDFVIALEGADLASFDIGNFSTLV